MSLIFVTMLARLRRPWPLKGDVPGIQLSGHHRCGQPCRYLFLTGVHHPQKAQTAGSTTVGVTIPAAMRERCERWDAQGLAEDQLPVMVNLHHLGSGV